MALKDALKVSRKTFFNPRAWLGYDNLKGTTQTIASFAKDAIRPPEVTQRKESFAEAMARQGVSEAEVQSIQRTYFIYALFFVVLAVLDFVYACYLLFHHHAFLALILGLAVCGLLLVQAFKYHFWYFQIKNRKLGCTFEEWKRGKINPSQSTQEDNAS